MNTTRRKYSEGVRIVWTIAAKDIVDALRNKTIFFNILTVFFIMAVYQRLSPLMYTTDPDVVVYDAGGSRLVAALESSPQFALHRASSIRDLKEQMGSHSRGDIGLAIPADFDRRLASAASEAGGAPELGGYVIWSSRSKAAELKSNCERQLTELLGQPVQINIKDTVYPDPDSMGPIRMVSVTLVLIIILMSVFTVPYLMFEEKRTKTLDALLISPASISQVVMGKALAGSFYCLTAVGVAFAFNWAFVTHWGLAIVAVLSGTLLAVGLGLLLGTLFENQYQMMIWAMIPGYILLIPVFLSVVDPILPETLRAVIYWIPTVALSLVFRYSFSDGATLAQILFHLGIVLASAGLVLAAVVWKVRRSDR
jgi:ABC-2 type transport system permease protein